MSCSSLDEKTHDEIMNIIPQWKSNSPTLETVQESGGKIVKKQQQQQTQQIIESQQSQCMY